MPSTIVREAGPAPIPPQEGCAPHQPDADAADAFAWTPGATPAPTPERPKAAKLTAEQVGEILSKISVAASAARALAARIGTDLGVSETAMEVFCVSYLLEQIGGLADYAQGEQACVGDFGDWLIGPLFHKEGRHV